MIPAFVAGLRVNGVRRPEPVAGCNNTRIDEEERRRKLHLISAARRFTIAATRQRGVNTDFRKLLRSYSEFYELRRHLSDDYLRNLYAPRLIHVSRDGAHMPALAEMFLDELDRLEEEVSR
jgi:hypothetical protein